ncbi:MAG: OmpA family protein [Bryobacteraceae bacterium]|jgi:outer membrane protein OmpA-like peptidoglycan-associated protein
MTTARLLMGASGLLIVALATPGCATKKYVLQQTGVVDARVSEVSKKQTEALANLERKEGTDISRVEERAMTAETRANEAARAAQQADQHAGEAGTAARGAADAAQQAQTHVGQVQKEMESAVENIDNYQLSSSNEILFGTNRATLTAEDKTKLEQIAQQVQGLKRYALEIQGFTDHTGPADYNLGLSTRRADVVMRYLVDHGVPLRRVHVIGLGPAPKTEGATTRATRKQMRRVNVNIYVPAAVAQQ